ncbi:hypothetical protein VHEMI00655 [[Torrubiella] hemipterigena]|uniref:Myb-like DNA-binding domain-containing protein n=1 Tax=[Torrubiella] hemipterigena TaxID=1531966 RepID=A0A0A1SQZ3_9HYPO|nr:hypothetical protein VHEMI00655 [[Torrubiella] hemipterigena]
MSKADAADHIRFLVACIKSTGAGRPDFDQVAEQLGIVTRGAAQKRYERLIKAHGLGPASAKPEKSEATEEDEANQTPKKRKAPAKARAPAAKKAKSDPVADSDVKVEGDSDEKVDPKLENGSVIA